MLVSTIVPIEDIIIILEGLFQHRFPILVLRRLLNYLQFRAKYTMTTVIATKIAVKQTVYVIGTDVDIIVLHHVVMQIVVMDAVAIVVIHIRIPHVVIQFVHVKVFAINFRIVHVKAMGVV